MAEQNAQIQLSDRFFEVGAGRSSSYPKLWTIAKECIQNSQDAHARKINFDVQGQWVTVTDDGDTMAPTGGIPNFLTIGESEKNKQTTDSTVGYFSTAKVRICFIHADWSITSGWEYVDKSMLGNAPITRTDEFVDGTVIRVKSREGDWDENEIRDYVSLCSPNIDVYLNGKKLKRNYRRGQHRVGFDWGQVYVNKSKNAAAQGYAVIRVNGLAMFKRNLWELQAQITIELDAVVSRLVLKESREGLVWHAKVNDEYVQPQQELDNYIKSLLINPNSISDKPKRVVRFNKGNKRTQEIQDAAKIEGGRNAISAFSEDAKKVDAPPIEISNDKLLELVKAGKVKPKDGSYLSPVVVGENGNEAVEWRTLGGTTADEPEDINFLLEMIDEPTQIEEVDERPEWMLELERRELERWLKLFEYDYVTIYHEDAGMPELQSRHARLLRAWYNVTKIVAKIAGISATFGVGLLFDQEERAAWVEDVNGNFIVIDSEAIRYSKDSKTTATMKLLRLATHEITHARGYSDHTETFMIMEGTLFDNCLEQMQWVLSACNGVTSGG